MWEDGGELSDGRFIKERDGEISFLNDQLSQVQNCMHDIIQVALFHAACCKKYYTCILLYCIYPILVKIALFYTWTQFSKFDYAFNCDVKMKKLYQPSWLTIKYLSIKMSTNDITFQNDH